jgi:hypothetical protein
LIPDYCHNSIGGDLLIPEFSTKPRIAVPAYTNKIGTTTNDYIKDCKTNMIKNYLKELIRNELTGLALMTRKAGTTKTVTAKNVSVSNPKSFITLTALEISISAFT